MAKKDKKNKSKATSTAPVKPANAARPPARSEDKSQAAAPRGAVSTKPVGRLRTFLREVRIEMKKVTWPPRKELVKSTGVVIFAVAVAAVFIFVLDRLWIYLVELSGMGG
jgi:preprotein translocase subunit SecE